MTYGKVRPMVLVLLMLVASGAETSVRAQAPGQEGLPRQDCELTIDRATISDPLTVSYDPFEPGLVTVNFEFDVINRQEGACDFQALIEPEDRMDEPQLHSLDATGDLLLYELRVRGAEAFDTSDASAAALGRITPGNKRETLRFQLRLAGEQAVRAGDYVRRFRIHVQLGDGDTVEFEEDVFDIVASVASALGIAFEPRFPDGLRAAEIVIPDLGLEPAFERKDLYVRGNVGYELQVSAQHGVLLHGRSGSSVAYRVDVNGRGEIDGRDLPFHFGHHPSTGATPRRHELSVHVPVADAVPLAGQYAETLTITVAPSD